MFHISKFKQTQERRKNLMAYQEENTIINYILEFIDETRIVKLQQLELIVLKTFTDNTRGDFFNAITSMRETGKIVITNDDWILDYRFYINVTGDAYLDNIDSGGKANFKKNIKEYLGKHIINQSDCMWIMASLIPKSREFVLNTFPWYVSFCMNRSYDNTSIYIRVTELDTNAALSQIKLLEDYMRMETKHFSDNTVSNVMLRNIDIAYLIPKGMFKNVCIIDSSNNFGYRVIDESEVGKYLDSDERYFKH